MEARFEKRFDKIDGRFDKVDDRFNQIEVRFDSLRDSFDTRMDELNARMLTTIRWTVGTIALFGTLIVILQAIAMFT